ncbi:hypothetical protein H0H92_003292 [Tricholoma furcatifolium]|nr:hypothetical protein H0H92_003292 [Tricholoma furcatifolium]
MASTMTMQKARWMKLGTSSFDIDEFVSKLITVMGCSRRLGDFVEESTEEESAEELETPLNWAKIGRQAVAKTRRVPVMGYMLGPLSLEQKQRAAPKRRRLEKRAENLRRPQEVGEDDIIRSKNETTRRYLLDLLPDAPLNIFKFIINPNDFGQSVENMFYLSFLIREGRVALEFINGEPMIGRCEQPSDEEHLDGLLPKKQMVFEFDMATWKRAIEVFTITESKIPQRPPINPEDKWFG